MNRRWIIFAVGFLAIVNCRAWGAEGEVTDDSGADATLGAFKSEVYGVGPAIDYVATIAKTDVDFQFKWYHEFESENRLAGNAFYLNMTFGF
jgi:hypothetical protein